MACPEARPDLLGHLRNVQIHLVTNPAQSHSADESRPPGPDEVPVLVRELFDLWNTSYEALTTASAPDR